MSRKKINRIIAAAASSFMILFFITGCSTVAKKSPTDTMTGGTIHISVDESFKPVMEEQIRMFEKSFPNAHIIANYKTEADCFKDFYNFFTVSG